MLSQSALVLMLISIFRERMHVFNDAITKFAQPFVGTRNVQIMDRAPPTLLTEISELYKHRLSFNEEETANLTFPHNLQGYHWSKSYGNLEKKAANV